MQLSKPKRYIILLNKYNEFFKNLINIIGKIYSDQKGILPK